MLLRAFLVWLCCIFAVGCDRAFAAVPTTTVFYVTDQRFNGNSYDEERFTFYVGNCANEDDVRSDDCALQYGYVQWDEHGTERYYPVKRKIFYSMLGQPQHALLFIHGFNEDLRRAVEEARYIAGRIDVKTGVRSSVPVIVYGWPARAATFSRIAFEAEYPNDETNNGWSKLHLRAFYRYFVNAESTTSLTVAAHSLGNALAVDMLLFARETGNSNVSHLISIEPDVDTQTYAESIDLLRRGTLQDVTVYGNQLDTALYLSQHLHAHCRAGQIYCEPLYVGQYSGNPMPGWLNVIDAQGVANACDPGFGHSYYIKSDIVLNDITDLATGKAPIMTKDKPREHFKYTDESGKTRPVPHFWIDVRGCE